MRKRGRRLHAWLQQRRQPGSKWQRHRWARVWNMRSCTLACIIPVSVCCLLAVVLARVPTQTTLLIAPLGFGSMVAPIHAPDCSFSVSHSGNQ